MRSVLLVLLGACTTLGPMPATTGISAVPNGRPNAEAQLGVMPAYHLSASVSNGDAGGTGQAAVLIEPDRWIGVPGLVVGGRVFGNAPDSPTEPMIGYRTALDDEFAVAVVAYGTSKRASSRGASYHGFRAGAEVAADGRIAAVTPWLSLHGQATVAVTRVVASGRYCVDDQGVGKDCHNDDPAQDMAVTGRIRGVYPSATASLALDVGRTGSGVFHSGRFALLLASGLMPRALDGVQTDAHSYFSIGASVTVGIGAR
jgi:hypothetical protein